MIEITTPDKITHILDSPEDIETYSSSPNTRAALSAAYHIGNWREYTPPPPPPPPLVELETDPPNWSDFRIALMMNTAFRQWAENLPADWREDLKATAILANDQALQSTYNQLAEIYPVDTAAAAEWQGIADANHIPVRFVG